jgi:aspartyl-tRNA(Asn)/glutamyl-tRNA(Gln) amidotransferase subunit C
MPISAEDVRHVARLARLDLSDEEVARFQVELSTILEYVARIEALEPAAAAESEPPDQPLRPDRAEPWPDVGLLHREAPVFEDGHFRVPRVVE